MNEKAKSADSYKDIVEFVKCYLTEMLLETNTYVVTRLCNELLDLIDDMEERLNLKSDKEA